LQSAGVRGCSSMAAGQRVLAASAEPDMVAARMTGPTVGAQPTGR